MAPHGTSARKSAGILLFREGRRLGLEVLLAHPGGPFWAKKDDGVWTIPKGVFGDDEEPLAAARREFEEETGFAVDGEFIPLDPVRQPSGKTLYIWALRGDLDPSGVKSNLFAAEWPPKSGRTRQFPEVDRADWFAPEAARRKLLKGQIPFLDQLEQRLGRRSTHGLS